MAEKFVVCTQFLECVFQYQTLISGILAIVAAGASVWAIWHSANLPVKAQKEQNKELEKRRLKFLCLTLSEDFRLLATRARQAEGTIIVTIAAKTNVTDDTRSKTSLKLHPILDEWEFMALLSTQLFNEIMTFRHLIEDHNFDMARAGGVFGDDNFKRIIQERTQKIQNKAMYLSSTIMGEFNKQIN